MTLDPASLQILISRLTGVAEEMGAVLRRAASSPNIKERADCSAALFTRSRISVMLPLVSSMTTTVIGVVWLSKSVIFWSWPLS